MVCMLALFSGGCTDSTDAPSGESGQMKAIKAFVYPSLVNPKVSTNDAIARVNGVAITRGDFDSWMALREIVFCLNKKLDPAKRQDKVISYRKSTRETAFLDLVRREVLRQECKRRGISPTPDEIKVGEKDFLKGIHREGKAFGAVCESMPKRVQEVLPGLIASDVRDNLLLKAWATNDVFTVSDQEVSNRLEYAKRYQHELESKNGEARRLAAAAKAEILAGASFYSVTTNRAEIFKDQGKEWDTVELGELDEESDLFRFLASANAGDISDPIDFDDGIGIVGVVAKELGAAPAGVAAAMQYTLVRCVFNAYDELDEPEGFEELRKVLLERKLRDARASLVRELTSRSKIELPYGDELFKRKQMKTKKLGKKAKKAGVRKAKGGK